MTCTVRTFLERHSFVIFLLLSLIFSPDVQCGWVLEWSDEFNYEGPPDPANWSYENGYVRNQEFQYYTSEPENVRVTGGRLIINGLVDNSYDRGYTAASIHTRGKQEFLYGLWEMRGTIDIRSGSWPAWWTLGVNNGWPRNGEIDIMEFYRGGLLANFAYDINGIHWDAITKQVTTFDDGWEDEFHVWQMIWNVDSIYLYVDSLLLNSIDLNVATDGNYNPFRDHNHYMLINQAIGGTQGGDPSNTEFPLVYEVDYVRFYQWDENVGVNETGVDVIKSQVAIRRSGDQLFFEVPRHMVWKNLNIFNSRGAMIEEYKVGETLIWDASNAGQGIYFLKLNGQKVRKYLLM